MIAQFVQCIHLVNLMKYGLNQEIIPVPLTLLSTEGLGMEPDMRSACRVRIRWNRNRTYLARVNSWKKETITQSYNKYNIESHIIQIYSGITCGRVLNGILNFNEQNCKPKEIHEDMITAYMYMSMALWSNLAQLH